MVMEIWRTIAPWFWRFLKTGGLLVLFGAVVYWVRFVPVRVVGYQLEHGTIVAEVLGTGTLEARIQATISPKISGRIATVLSDQGERVSTGDVLVQLDNEELSQQVAIARANVEAAVAAIDRLKIDKERAEAVFQQAQRSYDRSESLAKNNAVSQDDVDRATEALAVAVADVSRAESAIAEGQKALIAAEKTLQYHRARLQDTQIQAPFDGLIIKRHREPGDVVVPGSSILTLISTDELWVSAWVDETEMARLHEEQTARVVFRSEPDKSYLGQVSRLGREADRETRECIVDVRVMELPTNWAVGQRAEAFIKVAQKDDVLLLPTRLVTNYGNKLGVFLNVDGVAVWQPIVLGLRGRDAAEVLEGLNPEDLVITPTEQTQALSDGKRVILR